MASDPAWQQLQAEQGSSPEHCEGATPRTTRGSAGDEAELAGCSPGYGCLPPCCNAFTNLLNVMHQAKV